MNEHFTDEARALLQLASQAAQRWRHEYIGTEHVLLGLIEQGESVAINALKKLTVNPEQLRTDLERLLQPGPHVVSDVRLPTPRARRAIEFAVSQAGRWHESSVGSGHILIGLMREGEGVAAQVLMNRGVTLPAILAAVLSLLGGATILGLQASATSTGVSPIAGRPRFTYEHFTDRARKVMQLANQEALRHKHEYIGTEHILLGMAKEGSGVGAAVLNNLGVDLRNIPFEVDKLVLNGPDVVITGKLPQTPRAKNVIRQAMDEAGNLNHVNVGTEHLLLGLLREQEGIAAQVLMNAGLRLQQVRDEITRLLAAGIRWGAMPPVPGSPPAGIPIEGLPDDVKAVVERIGREIERLNRSKEEAVAAQDFERAAALRDEADNLAKQRRTALDNWSAHRPTDT